MFSPSLLWFTLGLTPLAGFFLRPRYRYTHGLLCLCLWLHGLVMLVYHHYQWVEVALIAYYTTVTFLYGVFVVALVATRLPVGLLVMRALLATQALTLLGLTLTGLGYLDLLTAWVWMSFAEAYWRAQTVLGVYQALLVIEKVNYVGPFCARSKRAMVNFCYHKCPSLVLTCLQYLRRR